MTTSTPTPGSLTCLPRFATPRDERFPTRGGEVGEVAKRLGTPLMPWQQAAVDVALEYDPVTERYRYREVDITVPRQSGKSRLVLAKNVHRMTKVALTLGPQVSTYTAQTRLKARKKLEKDFAPALRMTRSFREITAIRARPVKATEWKISLNNGSENIHFGSGSYLQIDAPNREGGHGDTLDDGTIDEAFAQRDDAVEGAMRPAMATRKNAQLWVISTAGDKNSAYLYRKVLAGRAASESGEHGPVCYLEFSADDDADPADPAVWASCMPALGHTIDLDFIEAEWDRLRRAGDEGIDTFRRAYLNQWPEVPVLGDETQTLSAFVQQWMSLADPKMPRPSSPQWGLAVSTDRAWSTLCGSDGHGVAVSANREGTGWVVVEAQRLTNTHGGEVAVRRSGPAGALIQPLKDAGVPVREITDVEWARACGGFHDAVMQGAIAHRGDAELDLSVRKAVTRPSGDTWVWSQAKSPVDIGPLCAAVSAHYAASNPTNSGWFMSF